MAGLFPYEPRAGQLEFVHSVERAVSEERAVVIEAATGTGKTISVLCGVLGATLGTGIKVLYTTRTNAQQVQVITELREIRRKHPIKAVALQGRRHLCLLARDDIEIKKSTPEEHTLLCSDKKKASLKLARISAKNRKLIEDEIETDALEAGDSRIFDSKACPYYSKLLNHDVPGLAEWVWNEVPTAEKFTSECLRRGICAYEGAKRLLAQADVVVVPYNFAFHPFIRRRLESYMGPLDRIVLVVDEAHNLPAFGRDQASSSLSMRSLELCENEAKRNRNPKLVDGISAGRFVRLMMEILEDIVEGYVVEDDGAIPPYEIETELMARLGMTSIAVNEAIIALEKHGSAIKDRKRAMGRIPRSYLHHLAAFLQFWRDMLAEDFMQLVIGHPNPAIEAFCMNPARTTGVVNAFHSSVHISGTLQPMNEYRDSIGLPPETELLTLDSPFPKDNMMLIHARDVTTRYEDIRFDRDNRARMMSHISSVLGQFDRSTAVFFPSFRLMNEFLDAGLSTKVKRPIFVEVQGTSQSEFMAVLNRFKKAGRADSADDDEVPAPSPKPVLFGVMGGRVGEGMDFPGEELEMAIIVGLPYPKPTARQRALQHYYELMFGKGWEYTIHAPVARKVRQALGRVIRSEDDRGVALLLDSRAEHFRREITGLRLSGDPLAEMHTFWRRTP